MKIRIHQKNTKLDIQTIMDMWYKVDVHEDSCSQWEYNPKCPIVKEKEKAYKVWHKVWDAPDSEAKDKHDEKEQARKAYFDLPQGEVLYVTYWFPKKDFNKVSNWFAQFEIPFEILNYEQSELEFMQDEIDCFENDTYSEIYAKYENLYKSETEEVEEEENA